MLHCFDSYAVVQLPSIGHSVTSISVVYGLVLDLLTCSCSSHPYVTVSTATSQYHRSGCSIDPILPNLRLPFSHTLSYQLISLLSFPSIKENTEHYSHLPVLFLSNLAFSTKGFPKLNAALLVALASAQLQDYLEDHPAPSISILHVPA